MRSKIYLLVLAAAFIGIGCPEMSTTRSPSDSTAPTPLGSEPFFPIGLLLVDDYSPRDPEDPPSKMTVLEEFPEIAEAGFNVIRGGRFDFDLDSPWGNTDANARLYLDAAQKSGMKVLMGLSCQDWIMGKNLSEDQLNLILKRVRALKDHPALWGWVFNDDTPQGGIQAEGQPLEPDPEKLRKIRRAIKEVDPIHPLVIAVPGEVDQDYEYRDIADIYQLDNLVIGFEVIPPGFPPEWEAHLEDVGKRIDQVYKVIGPKQKVIADVQTYNMANDSISWGGAPGDPNRLPDNLGRYPTSAEMRFMAYDAIIHKSQGVFFNSYRWDYKAFGRDDGEGRDDVSPRGNPSQWQVMASLATELKSMAPIFLAPDAEEIAVESEAVEFLLKEYNGHLYLIAANPSDREETATFAMSQPATAIKVLNEARSMTPEDGSFTDRFDAYGVHCYEISTAAAK